MHEKIIANCGIEIEILLNLKPYERFEFIRKHLIKLLKTSGEKYGHLSIGEVKKKVKIKPDIFSQIRQGYRNDTIVLAGLAECINEDLAVLTTKTGYEEEAKLARDRASLDEIKSSKKKPTKQVKPKGGRAYKFINHTGFHLSIEIINDEIHVYHNEEAPTTARIVLLAVQTIKVGKTEKKRLFPEEVKL